MNIEKYFNFQAKVLQTDVNTKDELLKEIAKSAMASDTLKEIDEKALLKQLKARESVGSTGFGDGIAIPHCTMNSIDDFVIGALISKNGIDFNALDGKAVNCFIYIIAPSQKRNEHIRILSELAKVLKTPTYVNELCEQNDSNSFFKKLSEYGNWDKTEELPQEYSQLSIHIQDSKVFDRVLELLAEVQDTHVTVLDGNNVGKYLYSLPLFSHFMNEEHKGFHRMILAVVNTVYVNDTLRKVGLIVKDLNCESKVMITSHPLNFFFGGLDI